MKKSAKKTLIRTIATACFVGSSCCTSMLLGQQLMPKQAKSDESLPPVVPSSQVNQSDLPPIIPAQQAGQLPPVNSPSPDSLELPPIVPATSAGQLLPASTVADINGQKLPPAVSVDAMLPTLAPATPPQTPAALKKGKNFPADADQQLAEFIRANSVVVPQIETTSFALDPTQDDQSPSDRNPNAAPGIVINPPVTNGQGQAHIINPPHADGAMQLDSGAHLQSGEYQTWNGGNSWEQAPGNDYFSSPEYGSMCSTFDCCGFICDARNYLIVDGLYWERTDGVFRASNITNIDDYDHKWGGRITWGSKRDCTRGVEVSYMQFDPWHAVSNQFDGGTLFGAVFGNAAGNLPASNFTAFRNGTFAQQFHKMDLHSAEYNKTWWGSDVAKAFIGARYIYFDEQFRLSMANTLGQQGFHQIDARNNMLGLHIGGEVLYDIGYRLSFSVGGKLGGYANFTEGRLQHINNGTFHVFNGDDETDFSWSGELGVWTRYKLTPNARLRAGYEVFGLFNVIDAENNYNPIVTNQSGTQFNDGSALFHGPSLGIEFYR